MTSSTLDPAPRIATPVVARGVGSNAETPQPAPASAATVGEALIRAGRWDYPQWLQHVQAAAGCTRPVRLAGDLYDIRRTPTGGATVVGAGRTEFLPDAVIYKACGNRRHRVCPSCADTYQRDAFQVVRTMLIGGKGVPDTVARHGAVFATFTAPSFGTVHTRRVSRHTCTTRRRCDCRPDPCHPRRHTGTCIHGRAAVCWARHDQADTLLGQPLCGDCYDHEHQVVWNLAAGKLWHRTKQNIERHLAALCRQRGIPFHTVTTIGPDGKPHTRTVPPVRVAHGKAAEFQTRGAVHFHTLLRLDGIDPTNPATVVAPPAGITLDDLIDAIRAAANATEWTTPEHLDRPTGWPITWGEQLDIQPITLTGRGEVTDLQVAGYLAKYATKSTEATGHLSTRITADTIAVHANPDGDHTARLIHACWHLSRPSAVGFPHHTPAAHIPRPALPDARHDPRNTGQPKPGTVPRRRKPCQPRLDIKTPNQAANGFYQGLRRWAHMLGYGGHFLTKARHHHVTFGFLRDTRIRYRRTENTQPEHDPAIRAADHTTAETTLVVGILTYAGSGWRTTGDALLANTAAALARARRQTGREELAHETGTASLALQRLAA